MTIAQMHAVGLDSPNWSNPPSAAQVAAGPGVRYYDRAANPRVFYYINTLGVFTAEASGSGGGAASLVTAATATGTQITAYTLNGTEAHTVTYPDSTHIVDVGGGKTLTTTLDANGNVISQVSV